MTKDNVVGDPKFELYRRVLKQVWEDGIVTSDEYAIMEKIREGLNITLEEHLEMESKVYLTLARSQFEKVHHKEAMDLYDAAIEADPKNALAWMNKGFHLQSVGRYDEALHCFDKVLEIDPKNAQAYTMKGCSLDTLGAFEEAVEAFLAGLKLVPDDEWVHYNLGVAYFHLNEFEKAKAAFSRSLELNPHFTGPMKYIEMIDAQDT